MQSQTFSATTLSIVFIISVAAFLRLYGLNFWELTVDEYYLAKSTISVSKDGIPNFPDGGYYIRGILQQYITAAIYLASGDIEFSIRIIPALSNIVTLPAVYLIAKLLSNNKTGLLATILLAFSLWEIEFSRFGRMYAPFQALFLWQIYFMLRYLKNGKLRDLSIGSSLSLISVFVYEGAIFSLLTSFFSLTLRPIAWKKMAAISPSFVGLGIALLMEKMELRNTESTTQPAIPSTGESSLPINFPELLYQSNDFSTFHWVIVSGGIALTFLLLFKGRREIQSSEIRVLYICLLAAQFGSVLVNQLLLAAILAGSLILIPTSNSSTRATLGLVNRLPIKIFLIWTFIWLAIYISLPDIQPNSFMSNATSFPELKERIYWPFKSTIPITVTWLLGSSIFLAILRIIFKNNIGVNVTLILAALMLVSISSFNTLYSISRYSFFLYPLFLIFFSITVLLIASLFKNRIVKATSVFSLLFLFLITSEDYRLDHLLNIASAKYNYRLPYPMDVQQHYYVRFDYKGPADFVNSNINDGDKILTSVEVVDFYLKKVDFTYVPEGLRAGLLACGGHCYIWNKTPLLSDDTKVRNLIEEANQNLWVIIHMPRNIYRDPIDHFIEEHFPKNKIYVNYDRSIAVYKF